MVTIFNIPLLLSFSRKLYPYGHSSQHSVIVAILNKLYPYGRSIQQSVPVVILKETVPLWPQYSTFRHCSHSQENCTLMVTVLNIPILFSS